MAPKSRALNVLQTILPEGHICLSCRRSLQQASRRQRYASAATATAPISNPEPPPPSSSTPTIAPDSAAHTQPRPVYNIHAGIVLSRAPILTRPLHPFERAFFLYQRRLNERLALPFTRYFYYKKGTPADLEWKQKIRARTTPSRDVGVYNAYSKEGWDDEVRVGDKLGEDIEEETRTRLIRDAEGDVGGDGSTEAGVGATPEGLQSGEKGALKGVEGQKSVDPLAIAKRRRRGAEIEKPQDRISKADREGDMSSLDRQGWRTVYLLVKGTDSTWHLPNTKLLHRENLKQGAERVIVQSGGSNMNTWVVGNGPVGHLATTYSKVMDNVERGVKELGEKIFFLKGRIMAGQVNLTGNMFGLSEYRWLTKEEVRAHVAEPYFEQVANMLSER